MVAMHDRRGGRSTGKPPAHAVHAFHRSETSHRERSEGGNEQDQQQQAGGRASRYPDG